jgi:hypothetical protein
MTPRARFAVLTLGSILSLSGCVNHGSVGPGPSPTPTAFPNLEVCIGAAAPSGYIRIDSAAAGLSGCSPTPSPTTPNVNIYMNYSNQPIGAQFPVCASEAVPPGYIAVSGPYHDDHGCDALVYAGTTFQNERMIYRQS